MRKRIGLFVFLLAVFCSSRITAQSQLPGNIYTVAGGGLLTNVSALSVALGNFPGVAVDGQGNVYVTASDLHVVYKVNTSGTAIVFAGNGILGEGGDGGPATSAQLVSPQGVAVDAQGNVYIADEGGHEIRKIDTSGIITRFAGSIDNGFGGDNGPATQAQLDLPASVAVDRAGNVYIADISEQRIRKVDTSGIITTFAGNGTAGFSGDNGPGTSAEINFPAGVAVDSSLNVYIADSNNNRVRKVDTTGKITTFAGGGTSGLGDGGPATSANLGGPEGVAVDAAGNVYIAAFNARVRKVDTSGNISTVAGNGNNGFSGDNGPATQAELNLPGYVAVVTSGSLAGTLFIGDILNRDIRQVDTSGTITSLAGNHFVADTGDGGPATSAQMALIFGITLDPSGNLFIADANDFLMRRVDTSGIITTIAGIGQNGSGGDGGPASQATLDPEALTSDASGNLFFADLANRIRKIDTSGNITTVAGNGQIGFSGDNGPATSAELGGPFLSLAIDGSGNLWIGDQANNRIRKVDGSGIITTVAGNGTAGFSGDNGPAINAEFNFISAIAFDGAGNLFVADQANNRIRKIDASGMVTTVAGNGAQGFSGDGGPATAAQIDPGNALALDSHGNLFIGEDERVRRVDSTGIITTVAGNGPGLFSGDGGPAVNAGIAGPIFGLAPDGHGNLLISDPVNRRVRKVINASGLALFNISSPSGSLMLSRGSTANVTLTINPANGFSGTVNLACTVTMIGSGSATPPTCSLNPSLVTLGAGASTATLTISAANQSSRFSPARRGFTAFLVFGTVLLSAVPIRKRKRSRRRHLLLLAGVLAIIGCGGGGSNPVIPPPTTTFSVTTTASIGNASASNAITVTVQ